MGEESGLTWIGGARWRRRRGRFAALGARVSGIAGDLGVGLGEADGDWARLLLVFVVGRGRGSSG